MSKDKSDTIMEAGDKVLWYPHSKRDTRMDQFRRQVNREHGLDLGESLDRCDLILFRGCNLAFIVVGLLAAMK